MAKVIFKFDKEKDLWNHWHKSNWKPSWHADFMKVHPKIMEICKEKTFEECKENLSENMKNLQSSYLIDLDIRLLSEAWNKIERVFFNRMDNLMKHNFEGNITAYLTTLGICPYDADEPSFMFSLFYSLPQQLKTCGHEIMHLYFHKFYWDSIESKIGKEKTGDLKEALTVLLNLEFKDLWFAKDFGYESHKELRNFISSCWKHNRDFDLLIEKCVEHLNTDLI